MKHHTTPDFWACFERLPTQIQERARASYERLKNDARHPALHFKKIDRFYSVRVGLHYRALGVEADDGVVWFWIGSHADYDQLIR